MHKVHKQPDESDANELSYLTPADYLEQRVEDQLRWYGRRSAENKRWYYRLQFITLFSAVSVPVLALSSGDMRVRFLVAVMGAVAALAAGVISVFQFRDQWLDYRATAESLKLEKHLFLTRTEPYADAQAFALFVQRIEAIIISENRSWQKKSFTLPQTDDNDVSAGKLSEGELHEGKTNSGDTDESESTTAIASERRELTD